MISVEQALAHIFDLITPTDVIDVPLQDAHGRVLARDVTALRDQPPFAASAMDGYATRQGDAVIGATLRVIGESAAGHGFTGTVGAGECVRIFTGAPLPDGTDRVVIQEDVSRAGDIATLLETLEAGPHVRPSGADFKTGDVIRAPRRLRAPDLSLLASMNHATVPVHRTPVVALLATGDELVMPGETPNAAQIIASNTFGLKAMVETAGGHARMLPIARDTKTSLRTVFKLAEGADVIVTIGGASVGDHDIVAPVAADLGFQQAFYKVAMRPGKPLMAGRMGDAMLLGLPGNPVSSLVCGHLFLLPALRAMQGLPAAQPQRARAKLATPVPANGPREHYMRASIGPDGLTAFHRQDSSLLSVLAEANALLIRPANDEARPAGTEVTYLPV